MINVDFDKVRVVTLEGKEVPIMDAHLVLGRALWQVAPSVDVHVFATEIFKWGKAETSKDVILYTIVFLEKNALMGYAFQQSIIGYLKSVIEPTTKTAEVSGNK